MNPPSSRAARGAGAGRAATAALALTAGAVTIVISACDFAAPPSSSPRPSPSINTQPEPTEETPTERPNPSGGVDIIAATDALSDLDSYRVTVSTRGLVPSSRADGTVTVVQTSVQQPDPGYASTIVGADGIDGDRLDAIVIGDRVWVKSGTGRWTSSPGGADVGNLLTTLSPDQLVQDFDELAGAMTKVGNETKDGRPSEHYRLDAATDAAAASAVGLSDGSIDLWLATTGRYLVGLLVNGTIDVNGTATPVLLKIDVDRVNDPRNVVRAPG